MAAGRGQYDRIIGFHTVTVGEDALGTETETRTLAEQAWALVRFGSGSERRDAGASGAVQMATFRVLSTPALRGVTQRDQVQFDGAWWGITSIAPVGPQGSEIEFTATRQGAA